MLVERSVGTWTRRRRFWVSGLVVGLAALLAAFLRGSDDGPHPSWRYAVPSPDGNLIVQLAFPLSPGHWLSAGLAVANPDGSDRRQLTTGDDKDPLWSPDGATILFDRFADGFHVVDVESGRERDLGIAGDTAAWSPDGTRIAYNDRRDVGVYDLARNENRKVVRAGLVCEVTWSPDGKRLAFVMTPPGLDPRLTWTLEVYVANADGHPRLRRVTFDRREDREPLWRPDRRITFIRAEQRYAVDPDRVGEPTPFHEPGVRPTAHIYPSDSFACP